MQNHPARLIVNRLPTEIADAAFVEVRALIARGGPEGDAAKELLRVIEARAESRRDAIEILTRAVKRGTLHTAPVLYGELLEDPKGEAVATFLLAEGAA